MSVKERILHSLLFEAFALCILMGAATLFTAHNPTVVGGVAIALSVLAMMWNYVYNLGFDRVFGHDRLSRKIGMRIAHGIGFEAGLLLVTIPLLMWVLQMDFWTVLILDLGIVIFFLVYSIIYNWAYDQVRSKITARATAV
ncbi:PACE efflux transporter [Photobacterium chitinilyticum]|uniref:PACE efflux transporter n=1 Tax=Photobacterium chitinilyticum TaxID=2485123 RepID=A0A3S3UMD3_9GAMM|nr:PACE efflux transporter [Photobacterium chitinilyticum]RWX57315.1 PACE efflux transporter [Photobacterium chitinilyticum]